jgi:two-component system response regulator ChvI
VRAILRRADQSVTSSGDQMVVLGDMTLDPDRHSCKWKGKDVKLTVTEFLILSALVRRPGIVKNRDQLLDAAYGENVYLDDRTIDSHIKRLRRKFREGDPTFDQIETLYGVGYKYLEQ